jgi:hypothetical protein
MVGILAECRLIKEKLKEVGMLADVNVSPMNPRLSEHHLEEWH